MQCCILSIAFEIYIFNWTRKFWRIRHNLPNLPKLFPSKILSHMVITLCVILLVSISWLFTLNWLHTSVGCLQVSVGCLQVSASCLQAGCTHQLVVNKLVAAGMINWLFLFLIILST